MEENESFDACCIRELAEETGYKIEPIQEFLQMNEYYEDWLFITHYFVCKVVGDAERKLSRVK